MVIFYRKFCVVIFGLELSAGARTAASLVAGEPKEPKILTSEVPGPKSKVLIDELNSINVWICSLIIYFHNHNQI